MWETTRRMMTEKRIGCDILLIAAQWRSRALLLGELQEAGYRVTALPGLRWALPPLARRGIDPSLAILDVTGDPEANAHQVEQVIRLLGETPVVLLAGVYNEQTFFPLRERVDAWLTRPLRIAQVVKTVQQLLPQDQAAEGGPR